MPVRSESHDALLDLIYGAVADPGSWPDVLVHLADHFGAIGGLLAYCAPVGKRSFGIVGRLSEEHTEIYHRHYVWNAWSLALKDAPFERALNTNALLADEKELTRTGFYADVLKPQGVINQLAISHRVMAQDGGVGGFGFSIGRNGEEGMEEKLKRLQRLTPHLGRALDATLRLGSITDGTRQLERVLQLMPNPALLLDGEGTVTHANPPAEKLLRTRDGLSLDRSGNLQLAAALPRESAALAKALSQALAVASGKGIELGEPLRLTRPSGEPSLLVLPIPLPPLAFAFWELHKPARVLVIIVDPAAQSHATASATQMAFGLTAAEARVATLIGSGLTGPQAAAMLGVSPSTVKTHLKRCFEKMGVHSQVALARVLSALPVDPTNRIKLS